MFDTQGHWLYRAACHFYRSVLRSVAAPGRAYGVLSMVVQAMVFQKTETGSVGQFHTCYDEAEAWAWVRTQQKDGCNVLVVKGKEDIELAWQLFGANKGRRNDDAERV